MIVLCLMAVPALVALAWIAFPYLEKLNLGYTAWHAACLLGFAFAGLGIVCWIAERSRGGPPPSWFILLSLLGLGLVAAALGFRGDSYWAFERGHFLH